MVVIKLSAPGNQLLCSYERLDAECDKGWEEKEQLNVPLAMVINMPLPIWRMLSLRKQPLLTIVSATRVLILDNGISVSKGKQKLGKSHSFFSSGTAQEAET